MKRFVLFVLLSFCTLVSLFAGKVYAGQEGYVCTIAKRHSIENDGTLDSAVRTPIVKKILESEFTVDRQSGKIIGVYVSTGGYKTEVLDIGSKQQSFKVLARSAFGFLHVMYLEIQEFSDEPYKPFVLIDGSVIYTGRCL